MNFMPVFTINYYKKTKLAYLKTDGELYGPYYSTLYHVQQTLHRTHSSQNVSFKPSTFLRSKDSIPNINCEYRILVSLENFDETSYAP